MIHKIKLQGGEELILSDKDFANFYSEYQQAKSNSTLISIGDGNMLPKSQVIRVCTDEESQYDLVKATLISWYGTFNNTSSGIKHDVENWIDYKDDAYERSSVERLVGEKEAKNYVQWMIDRFDKYPPEYQNYLRKPSTIYNNWEKLCKYSYDNLLSEKTRLWWKENKAEYNK